MSFKDKKLPPSRDFDKYFANFQNDPFASSVGLKSINPNSWNRFGPIQSSSQGYVEYLEEPTASSSLDPGGNTYVKPIGFDFEFDGKTYSNFIASPHGWIALLDPSASIDSSNLHKIYSQRLLASGSSSFCNTSITSSFINKDVFLAPWFDRLMMTHKDADSFITFYSGTAPSVVSQRENFLYGRSTTKDQPFDELTSGMRYATVDDSVDGKSLVVRWSSMGYGYRNKKLNFETAIYENGKIEFNYAPLESYSTDYTLVKLSADPSSVWKLDDTTASAIDSRGVQNLSHKSSVAYNVDGKISRAAFYSGSSTSVTYTGNSSFADFLVTNSFSFSAWFKTTDSSNQTIAGRMAYDFSRGYSLRLSGGYIEFTLNKTWNTSTLQARSTLNTYNDGQWHHVVVTYDGTATLNGIKIYVDGQQISTTGPYTSLTTSDNISSPSGQGKFMIGGVGIDNTNNQQFTGSLDDIAVWSSVLTSADANYIYSNGISSVSSADIQTIGLGSASATCGIFTSGSSTWNFRDLGPLLGSNSSRLMSDFGGALFTGSYTSIDTNTATTSSYTSNLNINNWPQRGGRITLMPPQLRRKQTRADIHENEKKRFFNETAYDDRKLINYKEENNVDASTTLPLFDVVNPSYPGVHLKQNLISSGGIRTNNRTIISAGHSVFLEDELENKEKISPFTEDRVYSSKSNDDSFFLTGSISSFGAERNSFSRSLANKKKIQITFPVDKKVKMLTSASSMYYFNPSAKQWNIPSSTLNDHTNNPFVKFSSKTTNLASGTSSGSIYLEDKIGFDAYGNSIISGSLDILRTSGAEPANQSTSEIGNLFNLSNHVELLSSEYPKSVQRNSDYNSSDELFVLPITEPFLVEKAVIELPFCMGNGWFNDKTSFLLVSASNFAHTSSMSVVTALPPLTFYDEGGPAITISLFCQKNFGTGSVRDLVFKSTFTHSDDDSGNADFVVARSGSLNQTWNAVIVGNKDNQNIISDSVNYNTVGSNKTFTGSVVVRSEAAISNAAQVAVFKSFNMSSYASSGSMLSSFSDFLNTEYTTLNDPISSSLLLGLDPFGRAMGGFEAGGEFSTTQDVLFGTSIKNPFYFSNASDRQTISSNLETKFNTQGTGSFVFCMSKASLGKPKQSPYVVYPGDKFILAASKTRPAFRSVDIRLNDASLAKGITNVVSSSYFSNISNAEGHDVVFNTGSISITLYGSSVKLGGETQ